VEVKNMKRTKRGIEVILLILIFAFSTAYAQKVETVDGVRVIHNGNQGKWGKDSKISLELVKTLGDINAEDENIAFYMPTDIVFDAQGNWYILDTGNHRIQKFSPDGKYLDTIGSRGQGPGEMSYPVSLDIYPEGNLLVSDPNNQRVQILLPDGKEYKTIRMTQGTIGAARILTTGQLVMNASGGFVMIGMGEEDKDKELPKLIKIIDMEGNTQKEFGTQRDYKNMMLNRMGNQVLFAVDKDNNIFLVFPFQNRIEKYSQEGKLLWRSDRELNYSMAPPKNKGKREVRGGNVRIEAPQMNRCANGIAVDDQGRIWVITLIRQVKEDEKVGQNISVQMTNGHRSMNVKVTGNTELEETDMYKLQIYDSEGVLLGNIPLKHFVDGITINKDRVYLVDKLRGTKCYEYKIVEK
jgi:sugar lactone lactonase YvrE